MVKRLGLVCALVGFLAVHTANAGTGLSDHKGGDSKCGSSACKDCSSLDCKGKSKYGTCQCDALIPNMIGDGGLGLPFMFADLNIQRHFTRVANNNFVKPRDRVSFTYNMLDGVDTLRTAAPSFRPPAEATLSEFTLQFEKTFLNDMVSAALIVPWAHTTKSEIGLGGIISEGAEMGDVAVNLKGLLLNRERLAISTGVLVEMPTAENLEVPPLTTLKMDAWYVTPYLGALYTPTSRLFVQSFLSYRTQVGDNPLSPTFPSPTDVEVKDPNLLMIDAAMGYWLYRNDCSSCITGLVPTIELHYTNSDGYYSGSAAILDEVGNVDYLNLTAGLTTILRDQSTVALAFAVPLRKNYTPNSGGINTDRNYEWQMMLQFNRYFGR